MVVNTWFQVQAKNTANWPIYYYFIYAWLSIQVSSHDLFSAQSHAFSHLCSHISHLTNSSYLDFSNCFYTYIYTLDICMYHIYLWKTNMAGGNTDTSFRYICIYIYFLLAMGNGPANHVNNWSRLNELLCFTFRSRQPRWCFRNMSTSFFQVTLLGVLFVTVSRVKWPHFGVIKRSIGRNWYLLCTSGVLFWPMFVFPIGSMGLVYLPTLIP